jgi:hypothetical protein
MDIVVYSDYVMRNCGTSRLHTVVNVERNEGGYDELGM